MKRLGCILTLAVALMMTIITACEPERVVIGSQERGLTGHHVGYSWSGESGGTNFEDATAYIETILELEEDGTIIDARMRFFRKIDAFWTTRQSGNAYVHIDYSITPGYGGLGSDYAPGDSMFTIYTADLMAFYAVGVNEAGIVAMTIVCPLTRYRFETRLPAGFDYSRPVSDLAVGSGLLVPTVRTSASAWLRPESWQELDGQHIFNFHRTSHVLNSRGVFEGIDGDSSVRELLEPAGVEFINNQPQAMDPVYGYTGIGGWAGNYQAIEEYLIGRNARDMISLVDWTQEHLAAGVNQERQFGVDSTTGATRTVQDSFDGIAGATVRMSRESTSFQRALLRAGIISQDDVIIGRF